MDITRKQVISAVSPLLDLKGGKVFSLVSHKVGKNSGLGTLLQYCDHVTDVSVNPTIYKIVPNIDLKDVENGKRVGVMPIEVMAVRPHVKNVKSCAKYYVGSNYHAFMGQNFYLSVQHWSTLFVGKDAGERSTIEPPLFADNELTNKVRNSFPTTNYLCTVNCAVVVVYLKDGKRIPALALSNSYGCPTTFSKALLPSVKQWATKAGVGVICLTDVYTSISNMHSVDGSAIKYVASLPFHPQITHSRMLPCRYPDYKSKFKRTEEGIVEVFTPYMLSYKGNQVKAYIGVRTDLGKRIPNPPPVRSTTARILRSNNTKKIVSHAQLHKLVKGL